MALRAAHCRFSGDFVQRAVAAFRGYSTRVNIENWAAGLRTKHFSLTEEFTNTRLQQLFATLPTRTPLPEGQEHSSRDPLPYGVQLAFFGRPSLESELRGDGTDVDFSPPPPFSRRVWAGGRMEWPSAPAYATRQSACAAVSVKDVRLHGFEQGNPMVFVDQQWEVAYHGDDLKEHPLVTETRTHAYLTMTTIPRQVRHFNDVPTKPDFSFTYTPTPTTLFRYSALTFNGHYIHLSADYARSEGYEERLVHGPLNAFMLLEVLSRNKSSAKFQSFEYRAVNPMTVSRPISIIGKWKLGGAVLWAVQDGTVGMTGTVVLYDEEALGLSSSRSCNGAN